MKTKLLRKLRKEAYDIYGIYMNTSHSFVVGRRSHLERGDIALTTVTNDYYDALNKLKQWRNSYILRQVKAIREENFLNRRNKELSKL